MDDVIGATEEKAEIKSTRNSIEEEEAEEENEGNCSEQRSVEQLEEEIRCKLILLENSQHVAPNYCIFTVPSKLRDENRAAYFPQYAHIGPLVYYTFLSRHEEDEKRRYLASFLERAKQRARLIDFIALIKDSLAMIRGCYEKTYYRYYDFQSNHVRQDKRGNESDSSLLIEMILADAGFIIELFLRAYSKEWREENDIIFAKAGTVHDIKQDLILLQNQLPFFLLRDMYKLAFTGNPDFPSFLHLTCHFFSHYYNQNISIDDMLSANNGHSEYRSKLEEAKHFTDLIRTFQLQPHSFQKHCINEESRCCKWVLKGKHFMDLVRSSWLPSSQKSIESEAEEELEEGKVQGQYLYSAVLLRQAGVKFKVSLSRCLFDVEFDQNNGGLKIPPLKVDNSTESFYGNLMVWEQCYHPDDTYICDYIFLMAYLIKSAEDVDLLVQRRILINQLGSPKAVVTMFSRLCKHIKVEKNRYSGLFRRLNAYNAVRHHSWIAILKLHYFSNLWTGVATMAAVVLLVLTLVQTICAIISL